jgi:pimeloyl-ACP methyl ester carboxylesterase
VYSKSKGLNLPQLHANGLDFEYEIHGSGDAVMLMIMGSGASVIWWPSSLIELLTVAGFRVVMFDNRDVGLSSRIIEPENGALAYDLTAMAADTAAIMDGLEIDAAHIVGLSMGGMIGQLLAGEYRARVSSLTTIMSPAGSPDIPIANTNFVGWPYEADPSSPFSEIVEMQAAAWGRLASERNRPDAAALKAQVQLAVKRSYDPAAAMRHAMACGASHDRRDALAKIQTPTLVLHGRDDPLIPVCAAYDLAARIASAELRVLPLMGHDLPVSTISTIADAIVATAARSKSR